MQAQRAAPQVPQGKIELTGAEARIVSMLVSGHTHEEIAQVTKWAQGSISAFLQRARVRNQCKTTMQLIYEYGKEVGRAGIAGVSFSSSLGGVHAINGV